MYLHEKAAVSLEGGGGRSGVTWCDRTTVLTQAIGRFPVVTQRIRLEPEIEVEGFCSQPFICGEVPLDHISAEAATTPREVIRHFAMKWQLDSEALEGDSATTLIEHAESLYPLADDERLWA